jgi:hypothetical protein
MKAKIISEKGPVLVIPAVGTAPMLLLEWIAEREDYVGIKVRRDVTNRDPVLKIRFSKAPRSVYQEFLDYINNNL